MRAAFGVPELDERLDGGLDPGTVLLLTGSAGPAIRTLAHAFLVEGLARREGGLVLAADRSPSEIQDALMTLDPHLEEYEQEGALRYIPDEAGGERVRTGGDPDASWDLNALTATFDRAQQQLAGRSRTRVVVETADGLLSRSPPGASLRFLRVLLDRVRGSDALGLLVVDRSSHTPEVVDELEGMADGRLELRRASNALEARASADWLDQPADWFTVDAAGTGSTLRDALEHGSSGSPV